MKKSIRNQFALIFIGLMAGTVVLCLLINNLWLGQFYLKSKTDVLYDAYQTISAAARSDSYNQENFRQQLDQVCSTNNVTIYIVNSNSKTVFESVNGGRQLEYRLLDYIFGFRDDVIKILEQNEYYTVQRTGIKGKEYLEMYGRLDTGISFIMQTPLESIRESAALANRFFAYVGLACAIAGGIIIWLVSRKITKPILELSNISKRMVEFDFEAQYRGGTNNEIDMLGHNINMLSQSLEKTISDLKTANNELKHDIEKKEQIDEMRKEFLSNVSHELKTPIALIQGYAEGLKEGISEDKESRDYYCDVIVDEASKMNHMVQKLLTLNQLEFGNDVVSMERFDIVALISTYLQSAGLLAQQNNITVHMPEYEPIYVWADEFKVEEVFNNYFTNGMHHCTGERMLDVKIEIKDGRVRVSVFNTGEPIPEEAIPHIWEKFYKVDKARTREYGGSGVGLSIVKAIMESMNQEYGVENYADGVCFWFELETT
ncbi:MAG: two-component sensor histidine kinase [Lachnospiraceae bacterium]|nr:two-component sensor histidine kinase [Lachnospiraceae bacterium]